MAGQGAELLQKAEIEVGYFDKDMEDIIGSVNKEYIKEKEELAGNAPEFKLNGHILTTVIYRSTQTGEFIQTPEEVMVMNEVNHQRQNEADAGLAFIKSKGRISAGDYATRFGISPKTASRYLNKLVENGILFREGVNKGTKYSIKSH